MCNILQHHGVAIGKAQTVKCETLQDRQPYFFNRISVKGRETEKKLYINRDLRAVLTNLLEFAWILIQNSMYIAKDKYIYDY